jgi:hypothetical protein
VTENARNTRRGRFASLNARMCTPDFARQGMALSYT